MLYATKMNEERTKYMDTEYCPFVRVRESMRLSQMSCEVPDKQREYELSVWEGNCPLIRVCNVTRLCLECVKERDF